MNSKKAAKRGEPLRYLNQVVLPYQGDDCLVCPYDRNWGDYGRIYREGKSRLVSRMACEHRNGPAPSNAAEAAHECGNGHLGCVNPNHLTWKTNSANQMDKARHGTSIRGAKHPLVRLDEAAVREIRRILDSKIKVSTISHRLGVSQTSIYHIASGHTWKWLDQGSGE